MDSQLLSQNRGSSSNLHVSASWIHFRIGPELEQEEEIYLYGFQTTPHTMYFMELLLNLISWLVRVGYLVSGQ